MRTKYIAFALSLSMLSPLAVFAKPSASAVSRGSSVASARSSISPMRSAPVSRALSPTVSSFERNASRRAGAAAVNASIASKNSQTVPPGPSTAPQPVQTARPSPYTYTAPRPYYRPPAPPVYAPPQTVVHNHYHDDGGSSALTGLAAGMALGALASHHDEAVAAPRQVAPQPEPVAPAPDYSDYGSAPVPVHSSGSHWLAFCIILFVILPLIAAAAYVIFRIVTKDDDAPSSGIKMSMPPVKEPKKQDIVSGFPNMQPGSIMTVEDSYFANDPSSSNPQLHAELDKTGTITIAGVSTDSDNIVTLYADRKGDEFARLSIEDGEVVDSRYFSLVFEYPILGQADWEQWVGTEGMIGNQWFQTGDNQPVRWKRSIFSDTPDRIAPITESERIFLNGSQVVQNVTEMTYYRNTGFSSPFVKREYLLIRAIRSVDSAGNATCYVRTFAGVDMSPASLQLI